MRVPASREPLDRRTSTIVRLVFGATLGVARVDGAIAVTATGSAEGSRGMRGAVSIDALGAAETVGITADGARVTSFSFAFPLPSTNAVTMSSSTARPSR